MKKNKLTLLAFGLYSAASIAQSNVTVYGVMDLSYVGGNTFSVANGTATKATGNVFSESAESTSRLGFRGQEDLGGGASAFFTVEMALAPNSTSAISTATTANRQSFLGLKKTGVGDFAIGTQYTPIFNAVFKTDPGQANNMLGDVIYTRNSLSPSFTVATGTGAASGNENNISFTPRAQSALTLNSEVIGGFQGHAMVILNNTNSTQTTTVVGPTTTVTGGTNNQNGLGLAADYTWNKLFLTASWMGLKATNAYTLNSTTGAYSAGNPVMFGLNGANSLGTNVRDTQAYVGGFYDLDIVKVYAGWVSRKVSAEQEPNYFVKRQAEQIGFRGYLTPVIEGWASAGIGRYTGYGVGQPTANFNGWQMGANYWFSKRTNLYAIAGGQNTSTYATVNNGVTSGGNSVNINGYALGVRHTF